MFNQARAILWAQFRGLLNYYPKGMRGGSVFSAALMGVWYLSVCFIAWGVYAILSEARDANRVRELLGRTLFFATGYWQFVPVMLATTGLSLEFRKLIVYPVPHSQLFLLELLLRTSTSVEVLLVTTGAALGVLVNPVIPYWSVLAFLPFVTFNLALSAGITEVQKRIFARKYLREAAVLAIVLLGALPQWLLTTSLGEKVKVWSATLPPLPTPWGAVAGLASGSFTLYGVAVASIWTALAWWFGRTQFERGLRFDSESAQSSSSRAGVAPDGKSRNLIDRFFSWPGDLLPDPMAALVEKELRALARSPRFRLIFFMGFSFGLLIWLPMARRGGDSPVEASSGFGMENFLTLVCAYALLLLGEVCFLNSFGFDRGASQAYFVFPVTLRQALISKNIAAIFYILLEVAAITAVCSLVGMPVTLEKITQALLVCVTMSVFLMSIGNLTSVNNPRPVNPNRSMRSTPPGKAQIMLLVLYPLAFGPVALAYLAEFGFESPLAFYGVMAFNLLLAAIVYGVSLDSAVESAMANRERIVTALSQGEGPLAG